MLLPMLTLLLVSFGRGCYNSLIYLGEIFDQGLWRFRGKWEMKVQLVNQGRCYKLKLNAIMASFKLYSCMN